MYVTEFEIVTDVKQLQSLKADSLIIVTELGIVIDVKPLQPLKASLPIKVQRFFETTKYFRDFFCPVD